MGNAARLLRGNHFTNVQALMPRRHAERERVDADQLARAGAIMKEWQDKIAAGLAETDPQPRPIDDAWNRYREAVAMLPQMIKRMTAFEIQWVLQNPVEGVAFMKDEVRYRPHGTTIAPLDPAVAGALDAAMLGPGVTVRQTTGPNGRPVSEIVQKSAGKAWYRNPDGTAVFHTVKPGDAAAASEGFKRSLRTHAAADGTGSGGPPVVPQRGGIPSDWQAQRDARDALDKLIMQNSGGVETIGKRISSDEVAYVKSLAAAGKFKEAFDYMSNVVLKRPPVMTASKKVRR